MNQDLVEDFAGNEFDDEHLDDVVTESNETDTEIINNLQAFKLHPPLDSDVDSDVGTKNVNK